MNEHELRYVQRSVQDWKDVELHGLIQKIDQEQTRSWHRHAMWASPVSLMLAAYPLLMGILRLHWVELTLFVVASAIAFVATRKCLSDERRSRWKVAAQRELAQRRESASDSHADGRLLG
ncbi:MAG: hypothetical protein WCS09_02915 [Pseudomonadota bacterium]|jgi:hypothetical protein